MDTELMHYAACLFRLRPSFCWYSLCLPTEGWPGWVGLVGRLPIEMVYLSAVTHSSSNRARCWLTSSIRPTTFRTKSNLQNFITTRYFISGGCGCPSGLLHDASIGDDNGSRNGTQLRLPTRRRTASSVRLRRPNRHSRHELLCKVRILNLPSAVSSFCL